MLGDAIEIVVARLDVEPEAVRAAWLLLAEDERLRAGRFLLARDRRRFVVARAALRRLLGARLQARPEALEFAYGPRGKPALAGAAARSGLQFNLSRRDEVAVFAFVGQRAVGVDVETVRALPEADEIAARAFSRHERDAYFALEARARPRAFFDCWTRKEAFVKALGDGLGHGLGGFDVSLAPGAPARLLRVDGAPGERCGWTLHGFVPAPGMTGALVVRDGGAPAERIALRPLLATEMADERIAA